ncbi:hypothetical protein JOB18_044389 [Solea senegalensis]|uniref:Uncharacterized protein n=1 Tax=Solea senegalensis TaxID=28829 RepID=A0AAV6SIQ9_SOLSE|nr:hypothetical protein JOB18_044389 [Solea senegalensis]
MVASGCHGDHRQALRVSCQVMEQTRRECVLNAKQAPSLCPGVKLRDATEQRFKRASADADSKSVQTP